MASRSQTNRDFYAILGVGRNADAAEIKRAYRYVGNELSEPRMKIKQKAASVLLETPSFWTL